MLKSRSKSVDLHLDPADGLLSAYSWKSNLLCGVYREEMTSSIFYTSHATEDRYVVKGEGSVRDRSEERDERGKDMANNWRRKKYSAMMKKTIMNVKSAKHELFVVENVGDDTLNINDNATKNTMTLSENTCNKFSQEN